MDFPLTSEEEEVPETERFDRLTKEVSQVRSSRRGLQAPVASSGIGLLTRHSTVAEPGKVQPCRCFQPGDQYSTDADMPSNETALAFNPRNRSSANASPRRKTSDDDHVPMPLLEQQP